MKFKLTPKLFLISILLFVLLVFPLSGISGANGQPDALDILNILAYGGAGQMKFRIGGEPGGEDPNLDDFDWQTAYIGYHWEEENTNVWFRTTINVPESIGGFSLACRDMTLNLFMDNGGDVFVNGDFRGRFTWSNYHYKIAENIQPGQRYVIAIRGINEKGWGKLIDAHIDFSGMEQFQRKLQRLVWRLFIAKKIALESSDDPGYWRRLVDQIAEKAVASDAFQKGKEQALLKVLQQDIKPIEKLLPERFGFHYTNYDNNGTLLPWTNWDDALQREMNWYLDCPFESGYPKFVILTFMDGKYQIKRKSFIPAMQDGMGIISYIKYYHYKGKKDQRILRLARFMGDFLGDECVTPDSGKYPRFTRSTGRALLVPQPPDCGSQKDRPYEVEPDKGGIAGYALVLLYEETGDKKYLNQALHNARVLAANIREGNDMRSPWPFRVDYRTGDGRDEVSANMSYILRLFDKLVEDGYREFNEPRQKLWNWIMQYQIPSVRKDGMLWTQFHEDYQLPQNRNAWSPLNLARYFLEKKSKIDPDWREHVIALIEFVEQNFTTVRDGVIVCGEQDDDKNPWGGILANYGGVLAMYAAAVGSDDYKKIAFEALNYCMYAIDDDGCPGQSVKDQQRGGWQEDAHTDVVHNYMDAISVFPEWAK